MCADGKAGLGGADAGRPQPERLRIEDRAGVRIEVGEIGARAILHHRDGQGGRSGSRLRRIYGHEEGRERVVGRVADGDDLLAADGRGVEFVIVQDR